MWNTGTFTITQLFACNNTGLYDQALKDVFCAHWIYMYMYCLHWWKFDVTFFITIFWHLVDVPLFFSFLCYLLIKTFCVKKKHKQCLSHVIFRFKDSINKIMIVFSLTCCKKLWCWDFRFFIERRLYMYMLGVSLCSLCSLCSKNQHIKCKTSLYDI